MSEEDIVFLKNALNLYEFSIELRRESNDDVYELNQFISMRNKLSELIGVNLGQRYFY